MVDKWAGEKADLTEASSVAGKVELQVGLTVVVKDAAKAVVRVGWMESGKVALSGKIMVGVSVDETVEMLVLGTAGRMVVEKVVGWVALWEKHTVERMAAE